MKTKKTYMVDFRCPRCNVVLIGRRDDEVRILKTKPKAKLPCKHCKIECTLASGTDDLGLSYWYTQPAKTSKKAK
jgi:transcription elongation factor Elf1